MRPRRTSTSAVLLPLVVALVLVVGYNTYTLWSLAIQVVGNAKPCPAAADRQVLQEARELEQRTFTSGRIAVVRPFIPAHLDRLLEDMASWERPEFAPCRAEPLGRSDQKPDIVFYFSYGLHQFPDVVATLRRTWTAAGWRRCFAHMRVISAGLNETADRYLPGQKTANASRSSAEEEGQKRQPAPSGVVLMFFDLLLDPDFHNRYEYFLYMEPDLSAVRPGWLDQLQRECLLELHNFWMKGSMYVGPKYVSDETDTPWLFHINGNAIYHVGDPEFRAFVKQVRQLEGALTNPFDVTMYEFRRRRFTLSQRTIHKFLYGEYIQNYGVSGYSLRRVLAEKPNTFLVHKKHQCSECDPVEP